jgi:biopolymer transport protein ExbD
MMEQDDSFGPECENPINMIPLIDIMLVLLVVFMIAMPLISTSAVKSNHVETAVPGTEAEDSAADAEIVVESLQSISVNHNSTNVQGLAQALSSYAEGSRIVLEVNPQLSYADLSAVLAVLDGCAMNKIVFSGAGGHD